jgi:hypothetical protein
MPLSQDMASKFVNSVSIFLLMRCVSNCFPRKETIQATFSLLSLSRNTSLTKLTSLSIYCRRETQRVFFSRVVNE